MKDINLFEGIKKSGPVKKSNQSVMAGLVLLIISGSRDISFNNISYAGFILVAPKVQGAQWGGGKIYF